MLAPLGLGLGVRDLDVVAEDLVEADLEARDPGPADLLGLKLGDPRLAPLGIGAQLVELGMIAVADQAPFLDGQRRVVDQGRLDLGADLGAELERRLELVEPLRGPGRQPGLELGQEGQRPGQRDQVARASPGRCRPAPPAAPGRTPGRAGSAGRRAAPSCVTSSSTASSRSAISSVEVSGDVSHSARSRAPIGVAEQVDHLRAASPRACPRAASAPARGSAGSSRRAPACRRGDRGSAG